MLWVQRLHGFDGASPQGDRRAVRLVIWNADGTRPEMCGNGVRCVVDWLAHQGTLLEGETVAVHTDAGVRAATLLHHGAHSARVAVEMGAIRLGPNEIVRVDERATVDVAPVDVGNPHGVVFAPQGDVLAVVDAVRALAVFPHGVNVELVEAIDGALRVRVNERGVGWTRACGTGRLRRGRGGGAVGPGAQGRRHHRATRRGGAHRAGPGDRRGAQRPDDRAGEPGVPGELVMNAGGRRRHGGPMGALTPRLCTA